VTIVAKPRRRRGRALLALAGYLLLTLGLTYPLVAQFGRAIPGDGFDGWQNYWNLWWIKTAVLEQHTHPWFTHLLYYPTGVGLLFHTLNAFNGFITLPIQLALGLLPAYNTAVLFSFALGGLGAYLLARYVLGPGSSLLAAFAAGVIFTFSPFHIAHLLGHMQVISLEWIPFYALYLLKTVECGLETRNWKLAAGGATRSTLHAPRPVWRNGLLAAFFLALVALCDWYYVLYCLILTAVVVVWVLLRFALRRSVVTAPGGLNAQPAASRSRVLGRTLVIIAAIWLLWAVLFSPVLIPMLREAGQSRFMVPDPAQSHTLSADLLAFVTPQEFHPLWGDWAQEQGKRFTASLSEHQVFAGFAVLALAALGVWRGRKPGRLRAWVGLWLLALLTFVILALGPVLHIGGQTALLPGGGEIPLPYAWLVRVVPFMDISRSVSRFDAMVMLALGVLAALGLDGLVRRLPGWRGQIVAFAAIALIVFEFLPAPYPMSQPDTPDWYKTLAGDARPGAVLNLPMNWDRPGYLLYQTEHGKPLTVAYISRDDPRTLTDRVPVLQHFRHLGPDIIAFDLAAQGRQVLADLGVRWVTLDRYKMPGGREREYTEAAAQAIFGSQTPAYQDERLTVYEVTPSGATAPYLILGAGWEPYDPGSATRGFTGSAPLIVHAAVPGEATVRVSLTPGSAELDAPRLGADYVIRASIQPGANTLELRARQPGARVQVASLTLEQ
jgi:hypothetical protein